MSELNPWKKLSSKEVYSNPWIKVREDEVIQPDGTPGIYGVVEPKLAVGVLALKDDGIVLVGQYRYPINHYSWEIIEGGAEPGENGLETAKRELAEEAGLEASVWEELCPPIFLSNCFSTEKAVFYKASGFREVECNPDDTEVLQLRTVSTEKAKEMVLSGVISDSMSVIAIQSYLLSL